ncbi:SatD family protein [Phycicoccus flavus]|uniref:RNA polymerase subunit sigma-70 n=1 Tax=Phycicoccus flavus TaxID=2502783 RepID=A0A8T6R636_9MICO|nr:SatD family protein [Phycicoccus flavus]NHA69033.1 RNA polymerase subunit sigma-70 [Phycicoccus flavus]
MDRVKPRTSCCVLIGDLVGSREVPDRAALHDALAVALSTVDAVRPSRDGLRVTVGDEFQGSYPTLGEALDVALRVRLLLWPDADVRVGVGRGTVTVLDPGRGIEDGPAWWAARAAVEAVEAAADRAPTRLLRTGLRTADGPEDRVAEPGLDTSGPGAAVNAALLCQDHLVGSLSDRSRRLLRGLMDTETTQADLAAAEGISASAVSQRVRADGIGAVLASHRLLRDLP